MKQHRLSPTQRALVESRRSLAHPAAKPRPRRAKLHLVTSEGASELYVARSGRARRPRRVDPARASKDPGRELKRLRRSAKATLQEVERETRIRVRYLEALESNATADAFPAATYARAFLDEYARYLRVDPEPFLASHPASRGAEPPPALSDVLPPPDRPPPRWPQWVLSAACAAVVLGVLISTGDRGSHQTGTGSSPAPVHIDLAAVGPGLGAASESAPRVPIDPLPANGIVVELRDEGASCWVRATADGKPAFEQTLRSGATRRIQAVRTIDLRLGNARAVTLVINGHAIEMPRGAGNVLTLQIALEAGRITVRTARGDLIASL